MAKEAMVDGAGDPFVAAVGKAVDRLERSHGPLYAALLVHLPDRPANDWVLLVGSKKLAGDRFEGIRAIVSALKGMIPDEFSTQIRRVDVLDPDDPVVVRLSRAFTVAPGASVALVSCNVFGLEIDHAVLFAMKAPDSTASGRRKNSRRTRTTPTHNSPSEG